MALFKPVNFAGIGSLKNRMALAPMTRGRATLEGVVGEHHVEYYRQRANAGLVITEGTHISEDGVGWVCAPGIWSEEQVEAWKKVPEAVEKAGSKFVVQLWHTGRSSHSAFHGGKLPYAPSPIAIKGEVHVPPKGEKKPYEVPRELKAEEIPKLLEEFKIAAKNAMRIGAHGVEIHNANGYLLDEFLQSSTNKRTDKYGGSLENRLRLTEQVIDAVCSVMPADKVGIRFSPNGVFNDMGSEDYVETFTAAIELCARKRIGFVHIMDGLGFGFHNLGPQFTLKQTREIIEKVQGKDRATMIIGNCGHTQESGEKEIAEGNADVIAYGRPWIANPDLVRRFKEGIELTEVDGMDHWYGNNRPDVTTGYTTFKPAP